MQLFDLHVVILSKFGAPVKTDRIGSKLFYDHIINIYQICNFYYFIIIKMREKLCCFDIQNKCAKFGQKKGAIIDSSLYKSSSFFVFYEKSWFKIVI